MKTLIITLLLGLIGCSSKASPPSANQDSSVNLAAIQKRDGTNFIGVYLGMIAEHDGMGGVRMFSATSGEGLRWIPYPEFKAVYIDKSRPEYLSSGWTYRRGEKILYITEDGKKHPGKIFRVFRGGEQDDEYVFEIGLEPRFLRKFLVHTEELRHTD